MPIEPVIAINGRPYPIDDLNLEEKQYLFAALREPATVSDGPIVRQLLEGIPERERAGVHTFRLTASDIAAVGFGRECLVASQREGPSEITWPWPGMNGQQVLELLRQRASMKWTHLWEIVRDRVAQAVAAGEPCGISWRRSGYFIKLQQGTDPEARITYALSRIYLHQEPEYTKNPRTENYIGGYLRRLCETLRASGLCVEEIRDEKRIRISIKP